jgi:ABC-type polysaccharide transport system permease subunit
MNLTSNFVEVQSCIELLFVLSYFIVSLYFPFIIFVDKSLSDKSRELVKSMGYLFSFISVILVVSLIVAFHHPGNEMFSWCDFDTFGAYGDYKSCAKICL